MTTKEQVRLELERAGGSFLSGAQLARQLGVSRNAVWKAVQTLEKEGVPMEAIPNRGYAMIPAKQGLSASGIYGHLSDPQAFTLHVHDTVTSTNTLVRELAQQDAPEGTVVLANAQTAGKGRCGRTFYSPSRSGMYMSLLLRPKMPVEETLFITAAAAVAVSEAIDATAQMHTQIKWVNDIYLQERKVCGILTEAALDLENGMLRYAVLGIGVNLTPPAGGFPPELSGIAGSLFPEDGIPDCFADKLAAGVLSAFDARYKALPSHDFLSRYRERSMLTGRPVTVVQGEREQDALVLGIDDGCRLLVRYPDGREDVLSSGEVRIRPHLGENH